MTMRYRILHLLSVLMILLPAAARAEMATGEELLPPEEAFAISAEQRGEAVEVRFDIADGYYLYREKFAFQSLSEGVSLGEAGLPPGKVKQDEFFGRVETYRGDLRIQLPLNRTAAGAGELDLQVVSQGCADIGVCYPPMTSRLQVALADAAGDDGGGGLMEIIGNGVESLGLGLGGGDEELLPPERAFVPIVMPPVDGYIPVRFDIAEGYYLYRDKFSFALSDAGGASLGEALLPEGEEMEDPFFGLIQIYRDSVEARLPVQGLVAAAEAGLTLGYQGCADIGVCYPPQSSTLKVNLTPGALTASTAAAAGGGGSGGAGGAAGGGAALSEQGQIAATLSTASVWVTALTFYGLGLLLAFTPCVFPMVPILSGIIVGQGHGVTTRHALLLSVVYVLAMALTYTVLGVVIGLSGENVQVWFQNPWVLGAFATLFVLLSLSMFGFYELQMPSAIQSKLSDVSNHQKGGKLAGVAAMGFLSALIVGPCVTAPLVGALIYIAETGDGLLGGFALFSLSLGMGTPLLLIGASAGKLLPRVGPWMESVKAVFGVLLLGMAIWLLERVIPAGVTMLLVAALAIVSAIYLGALEPIREQHSGWHKLWKGGGVIALAYGVLLLIGAAGGGTSLLAPLKGVFASGGAAQAEHMQFRPVKGIDGLDAAVAQARAGGQTVMLDFYADWCVSCKEMEAFTFTDPGVQAALAGSVLLQADVTANDAADQALLKRYGLFGPPAILFFDAGGRELPGKRVVGFVPADEFAAHVSSAVGG